MELSIIVPMFNTAKFIHRCLDSILNQSVNIGECEVIVVDDGSEDESYAVARELEAVHKNLRVLRQPNAGVGAARNLGLRHAAGRYVWFVDSDDYLPQSALPPMLAELVDRSPDVLVLDCTCADETGRPAKWIEFDFMPAGNATVDGATFFRLNYRWTYMCCYVFRRSLLMDNHIEFAPRINMQDADLIPRALACAEHVYISRLQAYTYIRRTDSATNSEDPNVRDRWFYSTLEVRQRLDAFRASLPSDNPMRVGLEMKIRALEELVLLSLVYDKIDWERRRRRVSQLHATRMLPFRLNADLCHSPAAKIKLLEQCANVAPVLFPAIYDRLRSFMHSVWRREIRT